jgi:cytoskeletal protein CcmA (bactofilin family)
MRTALFGGLLALFIVPVVSLGATFRTGDQPSFPAGETINDDLYIMGGGVTSAGMVQGDLTAMGGNVLVSGPVTADLLASGGSVIVTSTITGDVRAGGGNIVIQGSVLGDVLLGGGQITLSGPEIGGDVAIGGGTISIEAPVRGDIRIGGGMVFINSAVTGNVRIDADEVKLGPKANIAGDFTYSAKEAATMEGGAVVAGKTTFNERERAAAKAGIAAFFTVWLLMKVLMALVGAFAIGLLLHRFSRELVATAAPQPWYEIGRGALIFIVLPIASIILLCTVIGIPLGALGLLAFAALMIFAHLAAPIVAGSIAHKLIWKPAGYVVDWRTILLGVAIIFVLSLIPFVGDLVKFGIVLLTLGAAMNIKWSAIKEWR